MELGRVRVRGAVPCRGYHGRSVCAGFANGQGMGGATGSDQRLMSLFFLSQVVFSKAILGSLSSALIIWQRAIITKSFVAHAESNGLLLHSLPQSFP